MKFNCPFCGSGDVQYRASKNNMVCRRCGTEGTKEEFSIPPKNPTILKCPKCGYKCISYRFKEKQILCLKCGYKGKRETFIVKT